jgi:hypothetical protein
MNARVATILPPESVCVIDRLDIPIASELQHEVMTDL